MWRVLAWCAGQYRFWVLAVKQPVLVLPVAVTCAMS
jgi:hypothetical protein